MPTKKSTTLVKQQQQHFKWYYAIILIGIVAIVGILILRFSNAGAVKEIGMAESDVKTSVNASRDGYATIGNQTDSSLPGSGAQQTVRVANSNTLPRPGYIQMVVSYSDKFTYTTTNAVVRYCIYISNTGSYAPNGITLATHGEQKNFPNGNGGFFSSVSGYNIYCKDTNAYTLGAKNTQITSNFQAFAEASVNAPYTQLKLWKITREVIEAAK